MTEENGRVVERVLKTREPDKSFPTWTEIVVIEVLGERFLEALDDPAMLDIALADFEAIKEMRPDLEDHDLAYLVRTADYDEDAETWMLRVKTYEAHSIDRW